MSAVTDKIRRACRLIRERGDDGVWLALVPEEQVLETAARGESQNLPLAGWTFAVKDNIDVAGLPTTAACPEFSRRPEQNAFVVQRLIDAGAIVMGKTNLDQFATGLNGTRTPHTIPRNAFHPDYISGGSSSGSALAVALGEVDFSLGTDTAGSGRIPAAFNNLVGLKPTRGRWSNRGLLPACRSLDCMTVFARTLDAALRVDAIAKGFDPLDPYSRTEPFALPSTPRALGVLRADQREFFGDRDYARLYDEALERAAGLGWRLQPFDLAPFLETAALLYDGPWVAERLAAVGSFLREHHVHPVVQEIIARGAKYSAVDAFEGAYRLAGLRRQTEEVWQTIDALLLPTAGTIHTVEEMLAEPVRRNSHLGHYTNFMNLLDLCGIAVPAGFRADGLPFGVTFAGPAWTESMVANFAAGFLGEPVAVGSGVKVAVVGAHLSGQPLNAQLVALGARFVSAVRTASCYRLYALPGTQPPKPGLVRCENGGAIDAEVWELSEAAFGRLVSAIPAPLGIGTVELADGSTVKGFICEDYAVRGARDITCFGGWRGYLAAQG